MSSDFLIESPQKPENGKQGVSDDDVKRASQLVELMDDLEESPTAWRIRTILRIAVVAFFILVTVLLIGYVAWELMGH